MECFEFYFSCFEMFYVVHMFSIRPQLIDVATAAQTEASRDALFDLLTFEDADNVEYPQRFLFASAFSSHPSALSIKKLMVSAVLNIQSL